MIWVQGAAARVPHLLGGVGLCSCAGADHTLWGPSRRLLVLQKHSTSDFFPCILECADNDSVSAHSTGSKHCLGTCLTLLATAKGPGAERRTELATLCGAALAAEGVATSCSQQADDSDRYSGTYPPEAGGTGRAPCSNLMRRVLAWHHHGSLNAQQRPGCKHCILQQAGTGQCTLATAPGRRLGMMRVQHRSGGGRHRRVACSPWRAWPSCRAGQDLGQLLLLAVLKAPLQGALAAEAPAHKRKKFVWRWI